jgi:SPX domain protein involved in polyphosphate accumulation
MSLIPVEGHSYLWRDSETGAIVNGDDSNYQAYIRQRDARKNEKQEIESMKKDIDEIKNMLSKIIDKL